MRLTTPRSLAPAAILTAVMISALAMLPGRSPPGTIKPVGIPELIGWFNAQQQLLLPILPPGPTAFLQQGAPSALPFDADAFPLEVRKRLPGEIEHDCPVYSIYLVEDRDTRATVILNRDGEPVLSVPAPADYDPHAFVRAKFPVLDSAAYTDAERTALLAQYDPTRVQVVVKLVPADFYDTYMAATTAVAAEGLAESGGGMQPFDGGAFAITGMQPIGADVQLTFPGDETCYYAVDTCPAPDLAAWTPVDIVLGDAGDMAWPSRTATDSSASARFLRLPPGTRTRMASTTSRNSPSEPIL